MAEVITEERINQNAADALDAAIAEWLGVNRTDVICLDILARLGTVPAGRLAEESRLTTGAITAVLDRLERAGYVQRLDDLPTGAGCWSRPPSVSASSPSTPGGRWRDARGRGQPIHEGAARRGPGVPPLGAELSYRRAEEIAAEVADRADREGDALY